MIGTYTNKKITIIIIYVGGIGFHIRKVD